MILLMTNENVDFNIVLWFALRHCAVTDIYKFCMVLTSISTIIEYNRHRKTCWHFQSWRWTAKPINKTVIMKHALLVSLVFYRLRRTKSSVFVSKQMKCLLDYVCTGLIPFSFEVGAHRTHWNMMEHCATVCSREYWAICRWRSILRLYIRSCGRLGWRTLMQSEYRTRRFRHSERFWNEYENGDINFW